MPRLRLIFLLLLWWCGAASTEAAEGKRWSISTESGLDFFPATGVISLTNGVTVKYDGATLTADRMRLDQELGDCVAEGRVRLEREGRVWAGESLQYNFKTHEVLLGDSKAGQPPYFVAGASMAGSTEAKVYVLAHGWMTTDDVAEPGHRIRARTITVVPGDYIECEDATLYLGKVPVFWFPKWKRSLKKDVNHWTVVPGYRNKYGAYVLTAYEWFWDKRISGSVHFDERTRRGPGIGPDVKFELPKFGEGDFKYYYTHDRRPGEDAGGRPIDEDRQRVWFTYQNTLGTNLSLRGAVRYQSDAQLLRDFFESEYRDNPQPSTFLDLNQQWANWSLDLVAQARVNEFQETVERLPDIKLTGLRQQLGPTPLYYESESSFGYFRREFSQNDSTNFSAVRADTYHQMLVPWTFFDWLNITPRAGGRFTYYGEANGSGATTDEQERWIFNTGAEVSTKASRTWAGTRSKFWEIDGVRHIVQPSVNYAYIPRPAVRPDDLPQFDYQQPTTRLLPIEFPAYNNIDSIDSQNVIRLGLRNKLQTKRGGDVQNFVHWAVYADWRLGGRNGEAGFSDIYSDVDWKPFHWVSLSSEIVYDTERKALDLSYNSITFTPNDVWSWKFGNRYLREDAFFPAEDGNDLLFSSLYVRFDQNWGLRLSHYYNLAEGLFQHQYYSLYRDLRSFTAAMTFGITEDVGGEIDYGVAFTISSKAIPRYGLQDDINKPTRLLGY